MNAGGCSSIMGVLNSKQKKLKGNARWALLDRFTKPGGLE